MNLRRKQAILGFVTLPAFALLALAWRWMPMLTRTVALPADDPAARLAFVAHWLMLPGPTLLIGVVGAARRGFFADAIDGTRTPASHGLEINLRYNQNTVEQLLLAAIAWAGLGIALPLDRVACIPLAAALFTIGRITFWIGYRLHPLGRGFGMVLTVVPTIAGYAWLLGHAMPA